MRWVGLCLVLTGCGGALATDLFDSGAPNDAGDATTIDASFDVVLPDGPPADATCASAPQCSADLHTVVDCHGAVLVTCPDDQGCSNAANQPVCVPACSAVDEMHRPSGCEFYGVVPDVLAGYQLEGGCYAIALTNTWKATMTVTVERGGTSVGSGFVYIPSGGGASTTYAAAPADQIPAGATGLLFLARETNRNPACPVGVTPALTIDPAAHGTSYGDAFHVTTSLPATAADFVPYGASAYVASASVLLPLHAWDTSYVVVDGYAASQISGGVPSTDIVASQDGTVVKITPVVDIVASGSVAGATAGQATTYNLSKGQVLQFTQSAELTGSLLQSNQPVGVWGAHTCMNIDPSTGFCDSGHQQIPPLKGWGRDYAAVRYKNRSTTEETPPWRLVGFANGTILKFDPAVPGAPATLDQGQLATFTGAGPFRVTSQDVQHPFYLSAHMTGGQPLASIGDPEFVNVVPSSSWQDAYTFFTQPGFPETSLVVVRSSALGNGFQDVTLDCAGKLSGWTPIDGAGVYEYTRLDLSTGNFAGQNGCDTGAHTATSDAPFTITAWGWGNTQTSTISVSYALPAGM